MTLFKDGYYANYFDKSNILTGCTRASDKQIYQCSLPNVYPEISTPVGSVGLAGNTRGISKTIVTDNDYFSEFTRIQGLRLISSTNGFRKHRKWLRWISKRWCSRRRGCSRFMAPSSVPTRAFRSFLWWCPYQSRLCSDEWTMCLTN